MRSYGQYCSMARALDVVGDRWSLLIVRELLTQGDCRYSDLQRGLPGMASNLLAQRLREMEDAELLVRRDLPPPVASTVYTLTERGHELRGVVRELVRWGAPLMMEAPGVDEFRRHWMGLPLRFLCRDNEPDMTRSVVRLGDVRDGCDIVADAGIIDVLPPSVDRTPDATVTGPPPVLVGLFTGQVPLRDATSMGLLVVGHQACLRRILPRTPVLTIP